MPDSRLEALQNMVAQQPDAPFLRYGLAMEYRKTGEFEAAAAEFRKIIEANPDYAAAYYHAGQTLEAMGRRDEARRVYEAGIAVTTRSGDDKTRNELQAALDLL